MPTSLRSLGVVALLALHGVALAAANAASALQHVDPGHIALGYRAGAPSFPFRERDRVRGYSVGLCERAVAAIAKARNVAVPKIDRVALDAATRLDAVQSGRVDADRGNGTQRELLAS